MTNPCKQEAKIATLEVNIASIKDDVNTIKKSIISFVIANFIFFVCIVFYAGANFNQISTNTRNIELIKGE